jgi:hypothetical protein
LTQLPVSQKLSGQQGPPLEQFPLEPAGMQQMPSAQPWLASQQLGPWVPVHSVLSQGQMPHLLLQQNWPAAQQTPSQQVGFVAPQQSRP